MPSLTNLFVDEKIIFNGFHGNLWGCKNLNGFNSPITWIIKALKHISFWPDPAHLNGVQWEAVTPTHRETWCRVASSLCHQPNDIPSNPSLCSFPRWPCQYKRDSKITGASKFPDNLKMCMVFPLVLSYKCYDSFNYSTALHAVTYSFYISITQPFSDILLSSRGMKVLAMKSSTTSVVWRPNEKILTGAQFFEIPRHTNTI